MKALKKLFWGLSKYVFATGALLFPVFIVLLWFDFISDLKVNFFDRESFTRIVFFVWFLIVNGAYLWSEFKEEIKNIL